MAVQSLNGIQFVIPPWVSFRTYITDSETRVLLTNEQSHQTVFLEGASARIWKTIEDGVNCVEKLVAGRRSAGSDLSEQDVRDFVELLVNDRFLLAGSESQSNLFCGKKPPPRVERIEQSPLLDGMREFMVWLNSNGFLYSVHWEITWRCNERCIHCYNPGASHFDDEKPQRDTDELTFEQIERILHDLKEAGVAKITFSGGDPFVRRDFFDILKLSRKLGFIVDVYTNALLLKPEAMKKLIELFPSCVGISVYSSNPKMHDEITKVPGSFHKSVAALRELNQHGVRTAMKSIQMKQTVHGWQNTQDLARELGAGAEIDFGLTAGADGSSAPLDHAITDLGQLVVIALTENSPLYVGSREQGFHSIVRRKDDTVCGAGISSVGIDPEGTVSPCLSLPLPSGNLKKQTFAEIWKSRHREVFNEQHSAEINAEFFTDPVSALAKWRSITLKDYAECGTHDRCIWCQRCPGMSMSETGNPLLPSSMNCRNAAARMIAAALSYSGVTRAEACSLFGLDKQFGNLGSHYKAPSVPNASNRRDPQFDPKLLGLNAIGCASCEGSGAGNVSGTHEIHFPISSLTTRSATRGSAALKNADLLIEELQIEAAVKRDHFIN